jgi:hypothetical protein
VNKQDQDQNDATARDRSTDSSDRFEERIYACVMDAMEHYAANDSATFTDGFADWFASFKDGTGDGWYDRLVIDVNDCGRHSLRR